MATEQVGATEGVCEVCGEKIESPEKPCTEFLVGQNIGSGTTLGDNILDAIGKKKHQHHLFAGNGSIQAHHIICSESMNNEDWRIYANFVGYDINEAPNGIFLPSKMDVACKLAMPLHRGGHGDTETTMNLNYPRAVERKLERIENMIKDRTVCDKDDREMIVEELNELSEEILEYIEAFTWTITSDGIDYVSGNVGCCGFRSITAKKEAKNSGAGVTRCNIRSAHTITGTIPKTVSGVTGKKKVYTPKKQALKVST